MPLRTGKTLAAGSLSAEYVKTVTGFNPVRMKPAIRFGVSYSSSTFQQAFVGQYSLAAAGSTTIDFYSWTSQVDGAITSNKLRCVWFVCDATVVGGQLKVEPGASNALSLGISGSVTIDVGTGDDAYLCLGNGANITASNTVKNVKISNPGTQTITVNVMAIIGTA